MGPSVWCVAAVCFGLFGSLFSAFSVNVSVISCATLCCTFCFVFGAQFARCPSIVIESIWFGVLGPMEETNFHTRNTKEYNK